MQKKKNFFFSFIKKNGNRNFILKNVKITHKKIILFTNVATHWTQNDTGWTMDEKWSQ